MANLNGDIKLCKLTKKKNSINDLKALFELINHPEYICQKCGHGANKKKYICKPIAMKEK